MIEIDIFLIPLSYISPQTPLFTITITLGWVGLLYEIYKRLSILPSVSDSTEQPSWAQVSLS